MLPLADYDGEPVTVRLDDPDSAPIASDGLQKVLLKRKAPGSWILIVKARKWFDAMAANADAADIQLTVTIGTECFAHAATQKIADVP